MDGPAIEVLKWLVPGILIPMGLMVIRELKELNHQFARMVERMSWHGKKLEEHDDAISDHRERISILEGKLR